MSDLLKITIKKVEDTKCQAELCSIHPDQNRIQVIENIAFQIIMEAYRDFGPFENHPFKSKMDKWLSFMQREEVLINEEDYEAYLSEKKAIPAGYSGLGDNGGPHFNQKYLMKNENNQEFVRAANNEISWIELIEEENNGSYPKALIEFDVFDSELLQHLSEGMSWESAMYDRSAFM
jgi:hypothetical protein